jgi:hypothetical protein
MEVFISVAREPSGLFRKRFVLSTTYFFMLLLYAGIVIISLLGFSPSGMFVTLTYIQLGQSFMWAFVLTTAQVKKSFFFLKMC